MDFDFFNTPINNLESPLKQYNKFYDLSETSVKTISELILKTISDKRYMTYNHFNNNPMQMVERRLNMINAKSPKLVNSLNRRLCHPRIRNYCHTPFTN